jgi:hypothetical protein
MQGFTGGQRHGEKGTRLRVRHQASLAPHLYRNLHSLGMTSVSVSLSNVSPSFICVPGNREGEG